MIEVKYTPILNGNSQMTFRFVKFINLMTCKIGYLKKKLFIKIFNKYCIPIFLLPPKPKMNGVGEIS